MQSAITESPQHCYAGFSSLFRFACLLTLHLKNDATLRQSIGLNFSCSLPDEAATLFRATTLASTLMEQYMKATATPFVHHALKETILKIMESKQSCEV